MAREAGRICEVEAGLARLRSPESAEIHRGVSRAPAGQETLYGRVQDDFVQVLDPEESVTPDRGVL